MKKRNGFSRPFHILQVVSWGITAFHVLIPVMIAFNLNWEKLLGFVGTYAALFFVKVYYGYKLTKSDPTSQIDERYLDYNVVNYYCSLCKVFVKKRTKHCACCDRCVDDFDHHCKWLNNCIGQANYRLFVKLIISLELFTGFLAGFEIFLLSEQVQLDSDLLESTTFVVLVADVILNLVVFLANGYLICAHIYLAKLGLTTYEYLVTLRNKNKEVVPEESTGNMHSAHHSRVPSPGSN